MATASLVDPTQPTRWGSILSTAFLVLLFTALALGAFALFFLLRDISWGQWVQLLGMAMLTLLRVLTAVAIATLWTLPAGLAIGLSPPLSRFLQPIVQRLA